MSLLVPSVSCECSYRPVRLPQVFSSITLASPPTSQPSHAVCTEMLHNPRELSITVHLSLAEPSSSFSRNVPSLLSSSTICVWSICRVTMDPYYFFDRAYYACRLVLTFPRGGGKCRAGQPAPKPNLVPPPNGVTQPRMGEEMTVPKTK